MQQMNNKKKRSLWQPQQWWRHKNK